MISINWQVTLSWVQIKCEVENIAGDGMVKYMCSDDEDPNRDWDAWYPQSEILEMFVNTRVKCVNMKVAELQEISLDREMKMWGYGIGSFTWVSKSSLETGSGGAEEGRGG